MPFNCYVERAALKMNITVNLCSMVNFFGSLFCANQFLHTRIRPEVRVVENVCERIHLCQTRLWVEILFKKVNG